jgi:acyl-CoA thioester hydrolase
MPEQSREGVVRVRVRYAECDPMNVAHHGSFIAWFELARTEWLRERGASYAGLESRGILLMVGSVEIRYRRPVRYDDVIEIRTTLEHAGRVRLRHRYEARVVERDGSAAAEPVACEAVIELACCDRSGRPRALPEELWSAVGRGGERCG